MKPTFFATPADWRRWLAKHHASVVELLVGFYKKDSGHPSITWPESVDEALCYGWIDGVRRRIDEESYSIRFTPRRPGSIWSTVNTKRAGELIEAKRMRAPGLKAFKARLEAKTSIYAYEQRDDPKFTPSLLKRFKADAKAWKFFEAQPPYYRRIMTWYVISVKKEETQLKRLDRLMRDSAAGRRVR